ncbi:MAG: formylglycine-generating enzyme family protein [Myxococcota bacterium]
MTPTVEESRAFAQRGATWPAEDGSAMVHIPAGDFLYGPGAVRAYAGDFALAQHPVTNRQWKRFVEETNYLPDPAHPLGDRYLAHWQDGDPGPLVDHPLTHISWVDARHYCRWSGLALPTEIMWEKAARGVDGRPYPWGWGSPLTYRREGHRWVAQWVPHVGQPKTAPVGWNPALRTAWGCQDMIGNVSEICEPGGPSLDESDLSETLLAAHVRLRGSAFLRRTVDRGRMTCAHTRRLRTTGRNQWVGFRPAFVFDSSPVESDLSPPP